MARKEVTPKAFALLHGVHYNTVYYWISEGVIPCRRVLIHVRHRYYIPMDAETPVLKPGPNPARPPHALIAGVKKRTPRHSNSVQGSNINWDNLHRKRTNAKREALAQLNNP